MSELPNSLVQVINDLLDKEIHGSSNMFENEDVFSSYETICGSEYVLKEATFDHKSDIVYIWKEVFKDAIETYKSNSEFFHKQVKSKDFVIVDEIDSEDLPSKISKEAHKKNPIRIIVGIFNGENRYVPGKSTIYISFIPYSVVSRLNIKDLTYENLPKEVKELIDEMLSFKRLSSTISHELAHWLDDSLRNEKLKKYLKKLINIENDDELVLKQLTSFIEIEGYIHSTKQLKDSYTQKEWDSLSFSNLASETSLNTLIKKLKEKDETGEYLKKWIKRFFKRMVREGLLGKNMRPEEIKSL